MGKSRRKNIRDLNKSVLKTIQRIQISDDLRYFECSKLVGLNSPVVSPVVHIRNNDTWLSKSPADPDSQFDQSLDPAPDSESVVSSCKSISSDISGSEGSLSPVNLRETDDIVSELRQWTLSENLTLKAVDSLLKILKPRIPILPLSARTLLQTPVTSNSVVMGEGKYCHFGL